MFVRDFNTDSYITVEQWLSGSDVDLWCDDDCMPTPTSQDQDNEKDMADLANARVSRAEGSDVGDDVVHGVANAHKPLDRGFSGLNAVDPAKLKETCENGAAHPNDNPNDAKDGLSAGRKRKFENSTDPGFGDGNWFDSN
jgi:hypothetical protein